MFRPLGPVGSLRSALPVVVLRARCSGGEGGSHAQNTVSRGRPREPGRRGCRVVASASAVKAAWVNRVVDTWLIRQGMSTSPDGGRAPRARGPEVGDRQGLTRHPVLPGGFRIIVPLGLESRWARNVLVAGHCRLQVGDLVYELDEPVLVSPLLVEGLPPLARRVMGGSASIISGCAFAEGPGTLGDAGPRGPRGSPAGARASLTRRRGTRRARQRSPGRRLPSAVRVRVEMR